MKQWLNNWVYCKKCQLINRSHGLLSIFVFPFYYCISIRCTGFCFMLEAKWAPNGNVGAWELNLLLKDESPWNLFRVGWKNGYNLIWAQKPCLPKMIFPCLGCFLLPSETYINECTALFLESEIRVFSFEIQFKYQKLSSRRGWRVRTKVDHEITC